MKKAIFFLIPTLFLFLAFGKTNTTFAVCEAVCGTNSNYPLCSSPYCDTCSGCVSPAVPPPPEGIYNPAIKPTVGQGQGAEILAQLIANFLKIAYSIVGLVLLAMLLWGGIQWMTAGGDKEAISKAQKRITNALIGFAIFMSVFVIINFIAPALGLDFLNILKIQWPTP